MVQSGDELRVAEGGVNLPAAEVLTGRGFVTGKSGSGKSNTASVFLEELLSLNARLLVIDTDGEYYGLKTGYEVLHLGAGDQCDVEVEPVNAKIIAELVLEEGVPVVLDVSGFLEAEEANELVYEVAKHVFATAGSVRQPCLMLVEECHEYIPEQGGLGDVGEMLVRIAKRGRKRGLGLCGLSQRPAAVDKDFITQCDWLAWHRLTWANDTKVVKRVLGGEYAEQIEDLNTGESFLVTDWDESIRRVQFRKKRTFDAGATPGFGETRDPDLKPVPQSWLDEFAATKFKKDPEGVEDGVDAAPDRDPADEEVAETQVVEDDFPTDESSDGSSGEGAAEAADADDGGQRASAGGSSRRQSSDDEILQEHDGLGVHRSTASSRRSSRTSRPSSSRSYTTDLAEQLNAMDEWVGAKSPRVRRASGPPQDARSVAWELGQMVTFVGKATVWGVFAALYFVVRHVVGALLFVTARVAAGVSAVVRRVTAASRAGGRRAKAASQGGRRRSRSTGRAVGGRVASGLRAIGRHPRRAAVAARDAVVGPPDQSRVIVGGPDAPDVPRSDGGEEHQFTDLVVGGLVVFLLVALAAAAVVVAGPVTL